ncbi:pilus assembly protein PilM [Clostridium estertheticum]|uniref:pilus assembly protein PilM n=1 Tax=Clostridium estertheticum TaxID=238834 RepID=UPI001C0B55C6|nr:pilus assembly protein PilM [Clostridium estertheticum]MBU3198429.1 pilus assembly protein PilM [Clostridium estertheticum]WAG65110.1 pilus assembly protein PilM [Clostridium estertheticum]
MEKLKKINIKKLLTSDLSSLKRPRKVTIGLKPRKPFINKKVVSIDIGTQNIKVVVGKCSRNKMIIEKAFMFKSSVINSSEDSLKNLTVLPKEIEIVLKNNKIRVKSANCTGNSTTIINREIIVPNANEDELETLVKFELQHYLPINMDDFIVQFSILDKINVDGIDKLRILGVIYPNKLAKNYMELLQIAKLKPNALDVNYNSIKKLILHGDIISENEDYSQKTIAVIDMGAESLETNIYTNHKLEFARMIKSGGKQIDLNIAKVFKMNVIKAEAEKIKQCDLMNYEKSEMTKLIRDDVEEWMGELGRIIQFFKNKKVGNNISKIFIHGGSSRLKGLEEYMEARFNTPVKHINKLNNVVFNKAVNSEDIDCYLNAVGAIIRF